MPFAITYGMNHESFWDSNPSIVNAYEEAFKQQMKYEDEKMWNMGLYVYKAAYSAFGLIWCGKDFTPNYPEKPFTQLALQTEEEISDAEYDRRLRKALAAEEAYIVQQKMAGLPDII